MNWKQARTKYTEDNETTAEDSDDDDDDWQVRVIVEEVQVWAKEDHGNCSAVNDNDSDSEEDDDSDNERNGDCTWVHNSSLQFSVLACTEIYSISMFWSPEIMILRLCAEGRSAGAHRFKLISPFSPDLHPISFLELHRAINWV